MYIHVKSYKTQESKVQHSQFPHIYIAFLNFPLTVSRSVHVSTHAIFCNLMQSQYEN
jgi:hypothetical protein